MEFNQIVIKNLISKFEQIKSRMLAVINQLSEEDINWRPNEESNSIANLVIHIEGNVHQRIEAGIRGFEDKRDRDGEFDVSRVLSKKEAVEIIEESFKFLDITIRDLSNDDYVKSQRVRQNSVTTLDV